MMTPKFIDEGKDIRVVFGPCRISYPHVFEPHAANSDDTPKYSASILIPKAEQATISVLKKAIQAVFDRAISSKWAGLRPKDGYWNNPLMDGDSPKKTGEDRSEEYQDCLFVTAKSQQKPALFNKDGSDLEDEEEIYGGVWAYASVRFYSYSKGSKGIGCELFALKKFKDDTAWSGTNKKETASSDFSGLGNNDDDDL